MKMYVFFNVLIQIFILLTSVNIYFESLDIRLLASMFIISFIFIPSIIERGAKIKLKKKVHYLTTITCLLLFIVLIAM